MLALRRAQLSVLEIFIAAGWMDGFDGWLDGLVARGVDGGDAGSEGVGDGVGY